MFEKLIDFKFLETLAMGIVGVGTFIYYSLRKISDIKVKSDKKSKLPEPSLDKLFEGHDTLIRAYSDERELAIQQRDEAIIVSERLREANIEMADQIKKMSAEIADFKKQLKLVTELNRRLAKSLDAQRHHKSQDTSTTP